MKDSDGVSTINGVESAYLINFLNLCLGKIGWERLDIGRHAGRGLN